MDATRPRRLRDNVRRSWYAHWRSARFARHLGFPPSAALTPEPQARPCALPGGWFFPALRWGGVLASLWASLVWGPSERPLR